MMRNLRRAVGVVCVGVGVFLIIAAGVLAGVNARGESVAAESATRLGELSEAHVSAVRAVYEGYDVPADYALDESREMPVVSLDGVDVVGVIRVPARGVELPVAAAWDDGVSKKCACVFEGSAYEDRFVVAGHSYRAHFAGLYGAAVGDAVSFTDMDGNEFEYVVTGTDTVAGDDVDGLRDGDWNLTLFTCTRDSRSRVVVRCDRVDEEVFD